MTLQIHSYMFNQNNKLTVDLPFLQEKLQEKLHDNLFLQFSNISKQMTLNAYQTLINHELLVLIKSKRV